MAAGEHQPEPVVHDRRDGLDVGVAGVIDHGGLCLSGVAGRLATDPVDRPVVGRRGQPGPGIRGQAGLGPALQGDEVRLLGRLLGDVDVTEAAGQGGDDPTVLLTEDTVESHGRGARPDAGTCRSGLRLGLERPHLHRAPGRPRIPCRASSSAASRSGTSTIQKPPMCSFDSRYGPSVITGSPLPVPSTTVAVDAGLRPPAKTHEPAAWTSLLNARPPRTSPGRCPGSGRCRCRGRKAGTAPWCAPCVVVSGVRWCGVGVLGRAVIGADVGSGLADDLLAVDDLDVADTERAGRPQGQGDGARWT